MKPVALMLAMALIAPVTGLSAYAVTPSMRQEAGQAGAITKDEITPPGSDYYPTPAETGLGPDNQPVGPVVQIQGAGVKKIPLVPGQVTQSQIHGHVVPSIDP